MPPPSRHVGPGGFHLFLGLLLNHGFQPVRASPARGRSGCRFIIMKSLKLLVNTVMKMSSLTSRGRSKSGKGN